MKYGWVVLCLAFFGLAILAMSMVSAIEPSRASNSMQAENDVQISDKYVMWTQSGPSSNDIYAYPVGGGSQIQVTTGIGVMSPRLAGEHVVYLPHSDEIDIKNISDAKPATPLAGGMGMFSNFGYDGNFVVFGNESPLAGGKSLLMFKYYSFAQPGVYLIKSMSGTNLWMYSIDLYKGRAVIMYHDDTGDHTLIDDLPANNPSITGFYTSDTCKIAGNTAEYMICSNWNNVVYKLDLSNFKPTLINLRQPFGGMGYPTVQGNLLFYVNVTTDVFGFEIYMYQVDTGQITRLTYDQYQKNSIASGPGGWIAYLSNIDGQPDIYYFQIPKQAPDLIVQDNYIKLNPAVPVMGEKTRVNVTVMLKAPGPMKIDAKVRIQVTDPAGITTSTVMDLTALQPDTVSTVSYSVVFYNRGYATVDVQVRQNLGGSGGAAPQEVNLDNNKASARFFVADRPVANITTNIVKDSNITYSSLHFSGANSIDQDGINLYIWDLGDGTTLLGPEVDHTWKVSGNYQITLTVYDIYGIMGQVNYRIDIADQPPVPIYSVPQEAARNTTVVLSAAGSYDPDGQIVFVYWVIGVDAHYPGLMLDGPVVETMFSTGNATVPVTLHVMDDSGTMSSVDFEIKLVDAKAHNIPPIAVIQMTGNGLNVTFSGLSSFDPNGKVVSYGWTFSDGTTATGPRVNKSFAPGTYYATLKVRDDEGLDGTTTVGVTLSYIAPPTTIQKINQTIVKQTIGNPPPTCWASFQYENTTRGKIVFNAGGSEKGGKIVKYEWDFNGDGTWDWSSTTTGNTSYIYGKPAFYMALFRVTDNNGTSAVTAVSVSIRPDEIGAKPQKVESGVGMSTLLIVIIIAVVCAVVIAAVVGYAMSKKVAIVQKDMAAEQEVAETKKLIEESKTTGANVDEAEALIRQFEGR